MASILEGQNISFQFGERQIFSTLSFNVQPGSMVALLGPNGVGKTTLLNMIAGLLHPAEGRVLVDGRAVSDWPRRELSRFVALVPQHLEVPFSFRVEEIVAQGRVPYVGRFGALSAADWQTVENAMQSVDVLTLRDRIYSELSGGEKQRVKIAIALAQQPKLMLLDEPTQHLDIGRQIEIVNLMRRLNQRGITMFAAIHDLTIAKENFEHSIVLMNGSCNAGPTSQIMQPELLEKAFRVERSALQPFCEEPLPVRDFEAPRDCRRTRSARRWVRGSRSPRP